MAKGALLSVIGIISIVSITFYSFLIDNPQNNKPCPDVQYLLIFILVILSSFSVLRYQHDIIEYNRHEQTKGNS